MGSEVMGVDLLIQRLEKKQHLAILGVVLLLVHLSAADLPFADDYREESSIWGSLYDGFANIAQRVEEGISYVGSHSKDVLEFLVFANKLVQNTVDEECVFRCPKGSYPRANPAHMMSSNGCGSLGFRMGGDQLPSRGMEACCDTHDLCYDTCGSDKDYCDLDFRRCLYATCKKPKASDYIEETKCKAGAKILYTTTVALGCEPYLEAQGKACKCLKGKSEL